MENRKWFAKTRVILAVLAVTAVSDSTLFAQATGRVQGQVIEAGTLAPLASVQVYIPGTQLGTLTDYEGRFALSDVPAGEVTVRTQLIGYATEEQALTIRSDQTATVNFQLSPSAVDLDAVVVTGTPGAVARREIGNAIAQVDAAQIVEVAPVTNVNQLLTGRTAGLVVMSQSGNLGSGAPIRLRGSGSLSLSGQPIVYVDGIRVDADPDDGGIFGHVGTSRLMDFNPEDIASIEIIKGPAAATLYGTEASNGVIQIITKKGRPGQTTIGFSVTQGANWFRDAEERIPYNWDRQADGTLISQNLVGSEKAAGRPIFRTGHVQSYGANIRGGEAGIGYYLSADYEDAEGYYLNNELRRFSTRANISTQVTDGLNVNMNLGFVTSENPRQQEGFSDDQGIIANILFATPLSRNTPTRGFFRAPPEESNEIRLQQDINRFTWSLQATHEPLSWFTQRLNAGRDVVDETNFELWPRQPEGADHFFGSRGEGQKEINEVQVTNITVDYAGTATLDLTPNLNTATSFGVQYFSTKTERTYALGRIFPSPAVTTIGSAAQTFSDETFVENKTLGVFVQERLSWDDRLFFTGAVRADDNSAFGRDYDIVIYPKLSGVWVVSEEDFWNSSWANELRLRAAWGMAGQQPDAFAAVRTYSPITGANDGAGFIPDNPGNQKLEPEKGEELEAGFDASLLGGRLGVQFTYYDQTTHDAIVVKDVPPSTGFPGSQYVNLGQIDNSGMELALDARPVATPTVAWDLRGTLSHNENVITELGGPSISAGGFATIWHREGYPLGAFFSKRVVQAEETAEGEFVNVLCASGPEVESRPVPCGEAPMLYLGPPGPTWEGSLGTTVTLFGNLRLYALADFRADQRLFDITTFGRDAVFRNSERANKPELRDVTLRAAETLGINGQWVENHSFVSFRELSASYTFPESLASSFFQASRVNLRVAFRNLGYFYVHPSFRDLDPNVHRGGSTFVKSQQTLSPQPTSVLVSLDFTF